MSRTDLLKGKNSSLTKNMVKIIGEVGFLCFYSLACFAVCCGKGKRFFFSCVFVNCSSYRIGREKSQRTICSFSVENRILWTVDMMIIVLKRVEL